MEGKDVALGLKEVDSMGFGDQSEAGLEKVVYNWTSARNSWRNLKLWSRSICRCP